MRRVDIRFHMQTEAVQSVHGRRSEALERNSLDKLLQVGAIHWHEAPEFDTVSLAESATVEAEFKAGYSR